VVKSEERCSAESLPERQRTENERQRERKCKKKKIKQNVKRFAPAKKKKK